MKRSALIIIRNAVLVVCGAVMPLIQAQPASADHPIEVERRAAADEYLKAMISYRSIPSRRLTTSAILAAARSAWALGLVDDARQEFDRALRDTSLDPRTRASALVSRGAIEFQEGRYPVAAHFAEEATETAEANILVAALTLLADSLAKQSQFGEAASKLSAALEQASGSEVPALSFKLGNCLRKIGSLEKARTAYEKVPLDHEHAPAAIRALAEIALDEKNLDDALFWLSIGRDKFPNSFLDSWTDYATVLIEVERKDPERVRELLGEANTRLPPSDPWLMLLNATGEAYLWRESQLRGGR